MLRTVILVLDRIVSRVFALLCLFLFCVCLYATVDSVNVYFNANDTSILKYKPRPGEDAGILRELSGDAVGWLTIDGTSIDYPVMQGRNNFTYVNTNPYGEFSLSGSIFLDSRNSADFSDGFSLVYGHHMEYGAMFGALDAFYSADYLDAHQTGVLMTNAGTHYRLSVFACCKAEASGALIFNPTETGRADLLRYLEQNAAVFAPHSYDPDCPILALSTCQGADSLERLVVFCSLRLLGAEEE